jgi:hypothetical protein
MLRANVSSSMRADRPEALRIESSSLSFNAERLSRDRFWNRCCLVPEPRSEITPDKVDFSFRIGAGRTDPEENEAGPRKSGLADPAPEFLMM